MSDITVIPLQAATREVNGGAAVRELRREKRVPGVLYGQDENVHFSVPALDLKKLIYTTKLQMVDLDVDGKNYKCLVKDYQMHPVTDEILHVDLLALTKGHPVKVEIPIHFTGDPVGVKSGGTIVKKIRKLYIKALPELLKDEYEVDIAHLDMGDSVRVSDLETKKGVEVLNNPSSPLASIEVPRSLKAIEALEAEEAVAAAEALEARDGEEGAEASADEGDSAEGGEGAEGGDSGDEGGNS